MKKEKKEDQLCRRNKQFSGLKGKQNEGKGKKLTGVGWSESGNMKRGKKTNQQRTLLGGKIYLPEKGGEGKLSLEKIETEGKGRDHLRDSIFHTKRNIFPAIIKGE